jgi:hypothetical protein
MTKTLPTTAEGYVAGLRCGIDHGGNRRLSQDGAYVQCTGCGHWTPTETAATTLAAPITDGGMGGGGIYRIKEHGERAPYAIIDAHGVILSLHADPVPAGLGWGFDRELVELRLPHHIGDTIQWDAHGRETP